MNKKLIYLLLRNFCLLLPNHISGGQVLSPPGAVLILNVWSKFEVNRTYGFQLSFFFTTSNSCYFLTIFGSFDPINPGVLSKRLQKNHNADNISFITFVIAVKRPCKKSRGVRMVSLKNYQFSSHFLAHSCPKITQKMKFILWVEIIIVNNLCEHSKQNFLKQ